LFLGEVGILKIQDDWGDQDTATIIIKRKGGQRKNTARRDWTYKNDILFLELMFSS